MQKVVCAALVVGMTQSLKAEELKPINSDPPAFGLPVGQVLDILGIRLGDTFADAEAKIGGHYNVGTEREIVELMISSPEAPGNFIHEYVHSVRRKPQSPWEHMRAPFDSTIVYLATGLFDHRVIGVQRTIRFAETDRVSPAGFAREVEAKFGKPSTIIGGSLFYAFSTQGQRFEFGTDLHDIRCNKTDRLVPYQWSTIRKVDAECSAYLEVVVRGGAKVEEVDFRLMDYRRAAMHAKEMDALIRERLRQSHAGARGSKFKL